MLSNKFIIAIVMAGTVGCGNIMATRIPNTVGEVRAITEVRADIMEAVGVITVIATTIMATVITIKIGATMIETTITIISAITKAITTTIEP